MKGIIFLFFLSILGCFFLNNAIGANATTQSLTSVNKKIVTLKKNLALKTNQRDTLKSELKKMDQQVVLMTRELDAINQKILAKETALSASTKQLTDLKIEQEAQKKVLGQQLRASYQLGKYEYIHLLLNQQDPASVLRLMAYYNYINKARVETLAKIQATEEQIQQEQQKILEQRDQLNHLAQEKQAKKTQLEHSQATQQKIMTQLNQEIHTQSSQLKTYENDKKFLEALIQRLDRATKVKKSEETNASIESSAPMVYKIKTGPFSQEMHHLIWPTRGKLLNSATVPVMQHQPGIVILAPEGQSVVSVFPGKVVFAGALKGFGLLMILDHGQGYMTLYAHNQALYRKRGQRVNAGDLIAYVGHTGILPQSGLYFEVRHLGRPLKPLQWLEAKHE